MVGTFGKKPSDSHVIWTNRSGEGDGQKRFDFEYLRLWTANFGIDYETRTRVDHDRGDEPREQHCAVFEWVQMDGETMKMGGKEWTMGRSDTPRTFVEIDETGMARLKSWDREVVLDLRELWLDGPVLKMKTANHGTKALDTRKLLEEKRRASEA